MESQRRGLLHLQEEYFQNPAVEKPLPEIYRYMIPGLSDDIFTCGWAQEASRYCYGVTLQQQLNSIMMTMGIDTFPAFLDRIGTVVNSRF